MLAIMAIGAVALGIVLLAIRIVIGWFSKPAALRFDRAVRAFGNAVFQLTIVGIACVILVVVATALWG
jgi:hypothetical protein